MDLDEVRRRRLQRFLVDGVAPDPTEEKMPQSQPQAVLAATDGTRRRSDDGITITISGIRATDLLSTLVAHNLIPSRSSSATTQTHRFAPATSSSPIPPDQAPVNKENVNCDVDLSSIMIPPNGGTSFLQASVPDYSQQIAGRQTEGDQTLQAELPSPAISSTSVFMIQSDEDDVDSEEATTVKEHRSRGTNLAHRKLAHCSQASTSVASRLKLIAFQKSGEWDFESKPKRPRGRPPGSKNKTQKPPRAPKRKRDDEAGSSGTSKSGELKCNICREGRDEGNFCMTECGHLFHDSCLDRWIKTSSQKYRTNKICPFCGSKYQKSFPFYC